MAALREAPKFSSQTPARSSMNASTLNGSSLERLSLTSDNLLATTRSYIAACQLRAIWVHGCVFSSMRNIVVKVDHPSAAGVLLALSVIAAQDRNAAQDQELTTTLRSLCNTRPTSKPRSRSSALHMSCETGCASSTSATVHLCVGVLSLLVVSLAKNRRWPEERNILR